MKEELIKITTNEEGKQLVSARELHEFLEVTERFSNWFNRQLQYGFVENVDFTSVKSLTVVNNGAKKELQDYAITIDMAKEISMIQRTEQARRYFIKCEEKLREELKNKKTFELTKEGIIPLETREMFCIVPDSDKADMMIKLIDKFYPTGNNKSPKKDKPKIDLKQKAIDIFKECFDKAYYATRGKYILFYKEPVYKCASKSGITKRELNKILLKYDMVKTERERCATCCTRIDNKNYRAIYLKAELLNSQE